MKLNLGMKISQHLMIKEVRLDLPGSHHNYNRMGIHKDQGCHCMILCVCLQIQKPNSIEKEKLFKYYCVYIEP